MFAFEQTAETEPQTARDLQMVALRRLADMQDDLLHDDFQQGKTLAGLGDEKAVQKCIADRLRLKQGRSYSVEREVHVADEKEPDVRLRAKVTDASVPLEVKVAETWTLPQLEAALTTQLCDKYLRAREGRHGILLLVHQKPKPRGWTLRGKRLTFHDVVARLRARAAKSAGSAWDAPQPEVAVLDVSTFANKKAANKKVANKKVAKQEGSQQEGSQQEGSQQEGSQQEGSQQEGSQQEGSQQEGSQESGRQDKGSQKENSKARLASNASANRLRTNRSTGSASPIPHPRTRSASASAAGASECSGSGLGSSADDGRTESRPRVRRLESGALEIARSTMAHWLRPTCSPHLRTPSGPRPVGALQPQFSLFGAAVK